MFKQGEIVSFRHGEKLLYGVILHVEGCFCRLLPLVHVCPDGGESLAPADFAAATPELAGLDGVDPWTSCRVAGDALLAAHGRLVPAALDRLFRRMGRDAAAGHYAAVHAPKPFVPGVSAAPVSGKCWDIAEAENLVDASLDFWLTTGRFNAQFEKRFAAKLGRAHALTVNSGSSANLLAISALCSPLLKERRLRPGDEVITVAAGFPTTVAPLVQNGLIPVFVDCAAPTYNALPEQVAAAVTPKTRAIFMAHTLGNPFDIAKVKAVADRHGLWLVEDACDALGSTYTLDGVERMCGSFGDIATFSFYPAHHITMGEGGAVVCDDRLLHKILLSVRDWGRDCWCAPGTDDTCKRRYAWKFPLLPAGYDHKYVYSHLGYNLKITDMQAAVGLAQLDKLDRYTAARRRNFTRLHEALRPFDNEELVLPQATAGSNPSWFGFLISLNPRFSRQQFLEDMNTAKIGTRLLFAGNITRQPCFEGVAYRAPFPLTGTDAIMNHALWVGTFPGLTESHVAYMADRISRWLKQ